MARNDLWVAALPPRRFGATNLIGHFILAAKQRECQKRKQIKAIFFIRQVSG